MAPPSMFEANRGLRDGQIPIMVCVYVCVCVRVCVVCVCVCMSVLASLFRGVRLTR